MNCKICIEDIIYYGRYYSNIHDYPENLWWFCTDDYQVYRMDVLLNQFHYADSDDIIRVGRFIPVFKTDMFQLEQNYLSLLPIKAQKVYQNLEKQNPNRDYDTVFKIFLDQTNLMRDFYEFEKKVLSADAIHWCRKNSLRWEKSEKHETSPTVLMNNH